jgi:hypothetical protein
VAVDDVEDALSEMDNADVARLGEEVGDTIVVQVPRVDSIALGGSVERMSR